MAPEAWGITQTIPGLECFPATMKAPERKRAAGHVKETGLYARFSVKFQKLHAETQGKYKRLVIRRGHKRAIRYFA